MPARYWFSVSAVLSRAQHRSTTFQIVSKTEQRRVVLGGNRWTFDALSGAKLYLLEYQKGGYVVRLYDLAANKLDPLLSAIEDKARQTLIAPKSGSTYRFDIVLQGSGETQFLEL